MSYGFVRALDGATFKAERGEVVGLLGSNGAGKTTTMRILTTYLVPTAGSATVAGFDVVKDPLEVRKRIGYLPESLPLYLAMEVRECLAFVGRAGAHPRPRGRDPRRADDGPRPAPDRRDPQPHPRTREDEVRRAFDAHPSGGERARRPAD